MFWPDLTKMAETAGPGPKSGTTLIPCEMLMSAFEYANTRYFQDGVAKRVTCYEILDHQFSANSVQLVCQ